MMYRAQGNWLHGLQHGYKLHPPLRSSGGQFSWSTGDPYNISSQLKIIVGDFYCEAL
jgi:hypothetical protein